MTATDHRARAAKAEQTARDARDAAIAEESAKWARAVGEQPSSDRDLVDRYPQAAKALAAEERDARREFATAIVETEFGQAWVRARAAYFRRQTLTDDARVAASRLGERGPGEVGWRDPVLDADAIAALESAARSATQGDARPKRAAGIDPVLLAKLVHADGCPASRIEQVTGGVRCQDCGRNKVEPLPPEPLPPADSQRYRQLWRWNPSLIVEQLDDEQLADPRQNPKHANADPEPPSWYGGRPTR